MSAIGRARAGMFWRRNQFRFPGNGRMSGGVDGNAATKTDGGMPLKAARAPLTQTGALFPTDSGEATANPPAQNLTGEFTELLHAPEYDQRATAVAQEEA